MSAGIKAYILSFDSVNYLVLARSFSDAIEIWRENWNINEGEFEQPESLSILDVAEILFRKESHAGSH